MPFDTPILFIGGHRKCGTSMFLNLFDGHRRLAVYPHDINVLYAYHPRWLTTDYDDNARRARLERVVCSFFLENLKAAYTASGFDAAGFNDGFRQRIAGTRLTDIAGVIDALARAYVEAAKPPDPAWIILKETSCEIYAGELLAAFPKARFVHLLRDPRDNYGALKSGVESHYKRFGEDDHMILSSVLNRARLGMRMAQVNRERFGIGRYHVLCFEDLVRNPSERMSEICAFLGIDFDESMLVPTVLGQPTRGNSFEKVDFSKVSDRNVGRWRERISDEEAGVIEFHFGDLLTAFGYARELPIATAADAAASFYKWENDRYHYRDSFAR